MFYMTNFFNEYVKKVDKSVNFYFIGERHFLMKKNQIVFGIIEL